MYHTLAFPGQAYEILSEQANKSSANQIGALLGIRNPLIVVNGWAIHPPKNQP